MDILNDLEDLLFLKMMNTGFREGNKELFKSRDSLGFYSTGVNIIIEKNPELFEKSTRLNHVQFKALLNLIEPWLKKHSRRKPIEPEQRLYITLNFLAHGSSLHMISMKFRIGLETARRVVLETCEVLWRILKSMYVSPPNMAEWNKISEDFLNSTGLPHCLGAVDGKHIRIACPQKAGSQYFNYKKFHSIVLLAVCDSNYTFTLVDVGAYGSQSDGGVFKNSDFGKKILSKTLDTPAPKNLPGSNTFFPFYFVADAAFPLKENIMKPYAKVTDASKENFNKKISGARIRIEISFGILTSQWRILRTCMPFEPENAKKIVLATIVLHNYLRFDKVNSRGPEEADGQNLTSVNRQDLNTANTSAQSALNLRNELCDYLISI